MEGGGSLTGGVVSDHQRGHTPSNAFQHLPPQPARLVTPASPFSIGRTFVREHSRKYSANLVDS